MLIKYSTSKPVAAVANALKVAAKNHQFVLHIHDFKETLGKKGMTFAHECLIVEVSQPQQAQRVLEMKMGVSAGLPCRIAVYEDGGKTVLATMSPTRLIGLLNTPELDEVAREVEDTLVKIMEEGASS